MAIARGDQLGLAGFQRERRVDAGAQVESRRARRRVLRQLPPQPLVEDPDVNCFH
jgi:hypothetical protein